MTGREQLSLESGGLQPLHCLPLLLQSLCTLHAGGICQWRDIALIKFSGMKLTSNLSQHI